MSSNFSGAGAEHWQAYWQTAGAGSAAVSGDAPGDLFDWQWRDFFSRSFTSRQHPTLLDLACGAGVVTGRAIEAGAHTGSLLCGVDYASAAAAALNQKPAPSGYVVSGVAASVNQLPFLSGSFDIVVSQFGLEYAGLDAFREAARILAAGGSAQFITHYKDGGIDRECSANAHTLTAIIESDLFELAIAVIRGFAPEATDRQLHTVLVGLKSHLDGEPLAAKQMLSRLLPDVATLLSRRQAYGEVEALGWLAAMRNEVMLYADRMNAMTASAIGADGVKIAAELLASHGAVVESPAPLMPQGRSVPAAWLLRAHQPSS
ncbi:class I SAM-dependent methyltransferase [Hyphococcus sp.]|uniref:class I SAM-dependent methyltransferase n=1 Tax=Hyphococcus sp. TaxID=2038636 RepID=UPI002081BBD0|nr:MAG: hypothetical protein DHS20C04_06390 [Marinicaulis sp.]